MAAVTLNLQDNVLSSANNVNFKKLEEFGKLLMKIKKSSGPEIEPWGTPQSIERHSDNLLLKVTYYCLFVKYDLNQSKATPRNPYTLNLCNRVSWFSQREVAPG